MIDFVRKFFGKIAKDRVQGQGESPDHDIHIATCALLLEMSNIDGEFSESERDNIISILKHDYQLSDEHAAELIEASNESLQQSTDLWRFASLINQNYSIQEKMQVIEMIWTVAYADGKLDKHEDYLVHKLAKLLRLTHKQLIEAKLRTRAKINSQR